MTRVLTQLHALELLHGAALAGAGGGGFLLVVTRQPHARAALAPVVEAAGMVVHGVGIDPHGLTLRFEEDDAGSEGDDGPRHAIAPHTPHAPAALPEAPPVGSWGKPLHAH